jgi:hypothetical protein
MHDFLYGLLADVIVALHLAYVSFVIFGQLVIMLGAALKWQWVRNVPFRVIHLLMICVVAFEALIDFECPLTTWEGYLRKSAGQDVEAGTFVGRCMDALMFPDWPEEVYTPIYIGFALLVILTFVVAPPRLKRKHSPSRSDVGIAH